MLTNKLAARGEPTWWSGADVLLEKEIFADDFSNIVKKFILNPITYFKRVF